MQTRSRTAERRNGFTILELLMVIVIISIVAGFAIPKIDYTRYRADAAGRLIRTLLQGAQRNAITRQSNVIVSFDGTDNRLRIVQDYNNNDTLNTTDQTIFRSFPEGAKFGTPSFSGVNGTTPTAAFVGPNLRVVSSMQSITFRRDGSASSDAEIYVTMPRGNVKDYRAIVVSASTGRTELYRYGGSSWVRMSQ